MNDQTSLILRSPDARAIHVLEVDGPRRKHCRRGEGYYYLVTDNQPPCNDSFLLLDFPTDDPRLKEWGEPHWEIYQNHEGSVEIHACRATMKEIKEGDLHGALGSVIKLIHPTRRAIRNGLRLARRLTKADPINGVVVSASELDGIASTESAIKIYVSGGPYLKRLTDVLDAEEAAFVEAVMMKSGEKINKAFSADGTDRALWHKPEELKLIQCVGSYTWIPTTRIVLAMEVEN